MSSISLTRQILEGYTVPSKKKKSRGKENDTVSSSITCSLGPITNFSNMSCSYVECDYFSHGLRPNNDAEP